MKRLAVVALTMGLVGCAIEGPGPDGDDEVLDGNDDGTSFGDPTTGSEDPEGVVGDPAQSDPTETEPGPEDPGTTDGGPEEPPEEGDPSDPGPVNNTTNQVCYPGANNDYTACFPLVSKGSWSGYNYPSHSSSAYQAPKRFVDLNAIPSSTKIAPNFTIGEVMQSWKGQYGVYQVHMIEKLQAIRTSTGGPLNINSGYRRPSYNAGVGGATYSRHMYGDASDMYSSAVSLNGLKNQCNAKGADYVGMYSSHVHCDWRYESLDPGFFNDAQADWQGPAGRMSSHQHDILPHHVAALAVEPDGFWRAEATEFDEGEPYREWTAYDADGNILEVVAGDEYLPPVEAAVVEVMIGGQKMLRANADDPGNWMELPEGMVQVRLDTVAQRDVFQDDIIDWQSLPTTFE